MDELRFFWNLVWNPGKYSKRKSDFGSALKLYYSLSLIPFLAYVVIGAIAISMGIGAVSAMSTSPLAVAIASFATSVSYASLIGGAIVLFFIAIPVGLMINALVYQIVGKTFLNVWRGSYDKTFAALVYAVMPILLLMWLSVVPYMNSIFIVLAPLWSLVVFVTAMSAQQGITKLNVLVVGIVKSLLVVLVLTLLGLSVFAVVAQVLGSVLPAGIGAIPTNWMTNWGVTP